MVFVPFIIYILLYNFIPSIQYKAEWGSKDWSLNAMRMNLIINGNLFSAWTEYELLSALSFFNIFIVFLKIK